MLVIRDAQIQALIAAAAEDVVDAVEKAIRRAAPGRVTGIAAKRLRGMVERCVDRARAVGMEKTEDIAAFAAMMFVISPAFNDEPSVAEVLADTRYSAGERLFQLFERVSDESWLAAVKLYDARFWFDPGRDQTAAEGANEVPAEEPPTDYAKLAAQQADAVEAALKRAKESPGERSEKQLEVEVEKLCFSLTASQGTHKKRALRAAEAARAAILGKIVVRPPRGAR